MVLQAPHGKDSEKRSDWSRGETESGRLRQREECRRRIPGCWGAGTSWEAPDLAVRCSRGQESALAAGRLGSWKQKWAKSDSNIFSEPVKNITKMEKLISWLKVLIDYLKCQPSQLMPTWHHIWVRWQNKCSKTLFSYHAGRIARVPCKIRRHPDLFRHCSVGAELIPACFLAHATVLVVLRPKGWARNPVPAPGNCTSHLRGLWPCRSVPTRHLHWLWVPGPGPSANPKSPASTHCVFRVGDLQCSAALLHGLSPVCIMATSGGMSLGSGNSTDY